MISVEHSVGRRNESVDTAHGISEANTQGLIVQYRVSTKSPVAAIVRTDILPSIERRNKNRATVSKRGKIIRHAAIVVLLSEENVWYKQVNCTVKEGPECLVTRKR